MSTTAQSIKSFKTSLSETIQLFHLAQFQTRHGKDNALMALKTMLKGCIQDDRRYSNALVEALLVSGNGILEYIYVKDSNAADIIRANVLGENASDDSSTQDSSWHRALLRLNDFYQRLPPTIHIPNYQELTKAHQSIADFRQAFPKSPLNRDDEHTRLLKSVLEFYLTTLSSIAADIVEAYEQQPSHILEDTSEPNAEATSPYLGEYAASSELDYQLSSEDYITLYSIVAADRYVPHGQRQFEVYRIDEESTSVSDDFREVETIMYHPSSSIIYGRSGTGKTTVMISKMMALEKAADVLQTPLRQVFVTQSAVLTRRVAIFIERHKSLSDPQLQQESLSILDLVDEIVDAESTLPSRWSLLKQEDFPLCVTFDQICRLVEADVAPEFGITKYGDPQKVIKFEDFLRDIWPHFNQQLKRGLDASLVWSEFMGVIKGSEPSLKTGKGYIDRDTYLSLRSRFRDTEKGNVYSLFESYLKQKGELGRVDLPERTHAILKAIATKGLIGKSIDFLYVDEVQDNLLLDVGLLRKLCHSSHGLFWAGDSAQTIAVGSRFRFSELKSYLHNAELSEYPDRKPVVPQTLPLSINQRSQRAIVNTAASLVDLIHTFFPNSIDKLPQESSSRDGQKPIIFFPVSKNRNEFEKFFFGSEGQRKGYGAEQAILVRNETIQERLRDQIGDLAQVLTIYDSKGSEFNDVLLYDFFADSPASAADWRVVLNCMQNCPTPAPRFDELRHAIIQTELKFLYVGLTRARNRVWIWDSSDKSDPIRLLWSQRDLVNIEEPSEVPLNLAVQSSEHAWRKRAYAFFQQKLYDLSISAFRRAGMKMEERIAEAFKARSEAEKLPSGHPARPKAWEAAARAFDYSQELSSEDEKQQRRLRVMAAESYVEIPDYARAATLFLLSGQYTKAVLLFRKAGLVDNAMEVVLTQRAYVDPTVVKQTESIAKVFYTKRGELKKARALFRTPKDHAKFLEDLGLDNMLIEVYEDMREFDKAAQVALRQGDELRAARLHLKSTDGRSRDRAMKSLLNRLWKHFTLDSVLRPDDSYVDEVIKVAQAVKNIDLNDRNEMEVFAAIHKEDHAKLKTAIPELLKAKRRASAVLAMEHYLRLRGFSSIRIHPYMNERPVGKLEDEIGSQAHSLEEAVSIINIYSRYSSELRSMFFNMKKITQDGDVQKLLHFRPLESVMDDDARQYVVLRSESPPLSVAAYAKSFKASAEGDVVSQEDMERVLLRSLSNRYNERMRDLHGLTIVARALRPCPLYPIGVACVREGGSGCRYDHSDIKALSSSFPIRVRAHLQIILLLDRMMPDYATVSSDDPSQTFGKKNMQRIWLERLFECLFPSCPALGSLPRLGKNVLVAHPSWLPAVQAWVKARLFLLRPKGSLLDAVDYSQYAYEAGCARYNFQTLLCRPNTRKTVVLDIFDCLTRIAHTPTALDNGVASIEHIAYLQELPVDINVLTTYIEQLTTFMSFHSRLCYRHSEHSSLLDNLILPRSWMIQGLACLTSITKNHPTLPRETFAKLAEKLSYAVREILARMRGPSLSDATGSSLFYQNRVFGEARGLGRISFAISSLFRARLCRTLVILGYNLGQSQFQDWLVQHIFRTLWEPRPHDLYAKFVQSRSWVELKKALYESPLNVSSDQLCNLVFQTQPQKVNKVGGVSHILFSSQENLFSQMGFPDTAASMVSDSQRATVLQFNGEDTSSLEAPDSNDEGQYPASHDHKAKAVEVIGNAYKRHLKHQSSTKSGNRFFDLCLSRVNEGDGKAMPRAYAMAFLGPLPHLLAWFEEAMRTCASALKQQSLLLADESYDKYDDSFKIIAKLKPLRKDLKKLSKQLGPQSGLHSMGTLEALRKELKQVIPLKERVVMLLPSLSKAALENYRLASLGLLIPVTSNSRDMEEGA